MMGECGWKTLSPDNNHMDFSYIGSPQVDLWRNGTEYSEFVGSTGVPMNARKIASTSGYVKELSFTSFHPGGAMFTLGDGAVRFVSYTINSATYQALGSRGGAETIGDY